jgi:hypothetical protein
LGIEQDYATAMKGLTDFKFAEPFAAIADLLRAVQEAEQAERQCRTSVTQAEAALNSARSALGPVSGKIERAEKKNGLKPVVVPEFAQAPANVCASEAALRKQHVESLESDIRTLDREWNALTARHNEIKAKLGHVQALTKRAEGHLPDTSRDELPDLSLADEALEPALDEVIARLGDARATISRLEKGTESCFDEVRQLIEGENFRRLELQVADYLRRYSHRSAGAERVTLQARIAERIGIVRNEIENQIRDQNAYLEQLRLHFIHADELLLRAARPTWPRSRTRWEATSSSASWKLKACRNPSRLSPAMRIRNAAGSKTSRAQGWSHAFGICACAPSALPAAAMYLSSACPEASRRLIASLTETVTAFRRGRRQANTSPTWRSRATSSMKCRGLPNASPRSAWIG